VSASTIEMALVQTAWLVCLLLMHLSLLFHTSLQNTSALSYSLIYSTTQQSEISDSSKQLNLDIFNKQTYKDKGKPPSTFFFFF
jgi:hypothetical protein